MATKLPLVTVAGAGSNRRVVLFERHVDHPEGEAFVCNDGTNRKVAETAEVKRLLAAGELVKVNATPASVEKKATESK